MQLDINDLCQVSAELGEEIRVLGGVLRQNFDVREKGIYYATQSPQGMTEVLLHDFAGGNTRHVATIQPEVLFGFTVSPDERSILYTSGANYRSDLMLIENFR